MQVGNPTGGDKGAGTINAVAVYDDNTLLTDYVFDYYYDSEVSEEDKNLHSEYHILTLDELQAFIQENRHLPGIPSRADWERQGKPSVGQLLSGVWKNTEELSIYITELNSRLKELEAIAGIDSLQNSSTQIASDVAIITPISKFSRDSVGQAQILEGDMEVEIFFSQEYERKPIITVSPLDFIDDPYRIAAITTKGFSIQLKRAQNRDVDFSWHAFMPDAEIVLTVSNGSNANPAIEVEDGNNSNDSNADDTQPTTTSTEEEAQGAVAGASDEEGQEETPQTQAPINEEQEEQIAEGAPDASEPSKEEQSAPEESPAQEIESDSEEGVVEIATPTDPDPEPGSDLNSKAEPDPEPEPSNPEPEVETSDQ